MISGTSITPSDVKFHTNKSGERVLLGQGSFGRVFLATYKEEEVAIKEMHFVPDCHDHNSLMEDEFVKESSVLIMLSHPSIVNYYGFFRNDGRVCLVTAYIDGGDLFSLLRLCREKKTKLSTLEKIRITLDIARGISHFHMKLILNRDIKPSNIVLTKSRRALICDFGKARNFSTMQNTRSLCTPCFVAPEIENPEKYGMTTREYSPKSDVYSFGVVMWCILTEKNPTMHFNHISNPENNRYKDNESMKNYTKLMQWATREDHTTRIGMTEIMTLLVSLENQEVRNVRKKLTQLKKKFRESTSNLLDENVRLNKENKDLSDTQKENKKLTKLIQMLREENSELRRMCNESNQKIQSLRRNQPFPIKKKKNTSKMKQEPKTFVIETRNEIQVVASNRNQKHPQRKKEPQLIGVPQFNFFKKFTKYIRFSESCRKATLNIKNDMKNIFRGALIGNISLQNPGIFYLEFECYCKEMHAGFFVGIVSGNELRRKWNAVSENKEVSDDFVGFKKEEWSICSNTGEIFNDIESESARQSIEGKKKMEIIKGEITIVGLLLDFSDPKDGSLTFIINGRVMGEFDGISVPVTPKISFNINCKEKGSYIRIVERPNYVPQFEDSF